MIVKSANAYVVECDVAGCDVAGPPHPDHDQARREWLHAGGSDGAKAGTHLCPEHVETHCCSWCATPFETELPESEADDNGGRACQSCVELLTKED